MKVTAVYTRVSTKDKQNKGQMSQLDACLKYCENHDLDNIAIFQDKITGGENDRPALNNLRQAIFMGEIECVVVWKLDRISRDTRDGINILCDLLEKGIRVVSISEQFNFEGLVLLRGVSS